MKNIPHVTYTTSLYQRPSAEGGVEGPAGVGERGPESEGEGGEEPCTMPCNNRYKLSDFANLVFD